MSKTMFMTTKKEPEAPEYDWDWRRAYPIGSIVRIAEYGQETGWIWKSFRVVQFFPHIVHCIDKHGFNRCFTNWEFQARQQKLIDGIKGGQNSRKHGVATDGG